MTELKPCPFCGAPVTTEYDYIVCRHKSWCFFTIQERKTSDTATRLEAWNKRIPKITCKDCKHYHTLDGHSECSHRSWVYSNGAMCDFPYVKPNGYCYRAERREP